MQLHDGCWRRRVAEVCVGHESESYIDEGSACWSDAQGLHRVPQPLPTEVCPTPDSSASGRTDIP